MTEKPLLEIEQIGEITDEQLEQIGLTREAFTTQVNEQIAQIDTVINGFFDIRKSLKQKEPTDDEIDTLLDLFGTIKYYSLLFDEFKHGEILFNLDENGKMQVIESIKSGLTPDIPKNRTLN